jgi:hypothetical protein
MLANELKINPSVLLPTLIGIVGGDGASFAEAAGPNSVLGDSVLIHQVVFYIVSTHNGKNKVIPIGANCIGVTLN